MKINISESEFQVNGPQSLDIFVFNDDRLERLDSYQRFENWDGKDVSIASDSGDKIVFAIANSCFDRFGWVQVNCLKSMKKVTVSLENEIDGAITSSGMIRFRAGEKMDAPLELKPLASFVTVRSLRCDFSGRPYQNEKIFDARAYLINVNAECPVSYDEMSMPLRIINNGHLDMDNVNGFKRRESVLYTYTGPVGTSAAESSTMLCCFPNSCLEESPGTPFTKLVIEGKISGNTYYWTIPVNRGENGNIGIERNCNYIFDITLKRKGATSPDVDAIAESIICKLEVEKWKEKDEYPIAF